MSLLISRLSLELNIVPVESWPRRDLSGICFLRGSCSTLAVGREHRLRCHADVRTWSRKHLDAGLPSLGLALKLSDFS